MELRDRWYFNHLMEMHCKKLESIKKESGKRIDNSPPATIHFIKRKANSQLYVKNQEFRDLLKKNKVILNALNEINNRKVKITQKQYDFEAAPSPRTLNQTFKKQQLERIAFENYQFLERINQKEPTVSIKKFDDDFKQSLKYKKSLAKKQFFENAKTGYKKKLPSICEDSTKKELKATKSQRIIHTKMVDDEKIEDKVGEGRNLNQKSEEIHKQIENIDEIEQSGPLTKSISIETNEYNVEQLKNNEKEKEKGLMKANSFKKNINIEEALEFERKLMQDSVHEEKKILKNIEEEKKEINLDTKPKEANFTETKALEKEKPTNDTEKKETEALLKQQSMKNFMNSPKPNADIDHSEVDQTVKKAVTLTGKSHPEKLLKNS